MRATLLTIAALALASCNQGQTSQKRAEDAAYAALNRAGEANQRVESLEGDVEDLRYEVERLQAQQQ